MTEETRTGGVQGRWKIPVTPRRAAAFERDPEVVRKYGSKAGWAPWSLRFWRGLAVGFCIFSIVGHWIEIPYCLFNDWAFGIVDDNSLVFTDPMYPFCVYGIASVLCALLLVPQRDWLAYRYQPRWRAVLRFWLFAVLASMVGELSMGLLLNQPDPVTGVYPLWDNSYLPLNVLGQAWLVNDVLLGTLVTLYIWVLYPTLVKSLGALPESWGWPITIAVVVSFVILCIVKF
jgi:uncharacterized membrane protein